MNTMLEISLYLLQGLGGLLVVAFLLRFLMQLSRTSFYNPIAQTIYKITHFPVNSLSIILPPYRTFNSASLTLALILEFAIVMASFLLVGGALNNFLYPALWAVIGVLSMMLNIYLYGILIVVIVSWVAPHSQHPVITLIWQLVEPIIAPVRKFIPPVGGLDLSVMVVALGIGMLRIILRNLAGTLALAPSLVPGI